MNGSPQETKLLIKSVRSHFISHLPRTYFIATATLKNDDVEESGDEADENDTLVQARESRAIRVTHTPAERQPTGRIVGIVKRNWRAYVVSIFSNISILISVGSLYVLYIGMYATSMLPLSPPRRSLRWLLKMSLHPLYRVSFHAYAYARAKLLHYWGRKFL